jgi:hypothetical protein
VSTTERTDWPLKLKTEVSRGCFFYALSLLTNSVRSELGRAGIHPSSIAHVLTSHSSTYHVTSSSAVPSSGGAHRVQRERGQANCMTFQLLPMHGGPVCRLLVLPLPLGTWLLSPGPALVLHPPSPRLILQHSTLLGNRN